MTLTDAQKQIVQRNYLREVQQIKAVIELLRGKDVGIPLLRAEIEQVQTLDLLPSIDLTLLDRTKVISALDDALFTAFIIRNELLASGVDDKPV